MDPRATYLAAAGAVADLAGRLETADLARPGLGGWDVRGLLGHTSRAVVTVLTYVEQPAAQVDVPSAAGYLALVGQASAADVERRGVEAGAALGDDPAGRFAALVEDVAAALDAHADDEVVRTIAGGMRLGDYLPTRTFELVVHGLDLAAATGRPAAFDVDVLAAMASLAAEVAVREGRGETFLRAITGRVPFGRDLSIV